jgi:LCP family protein required for cell wall assembly
MKKLLLFFVLFLVLLSTIGYLWFSRLTKRVFVQSPSKKESTRKLPQSLQEYFATKTPFNILVAGYGGGKHDGAYLTDTLILVHVDPKLQKIHMVSIPRDIWVKIPTEGNNGRYWKINAAYAFGIDDRQYPNKLAEFTGADGGGRLAEHVVGNVTGQTIPYFVGLDFSGFTHTIDTLGGVDINVNPAFTDPEYPLEGKEADLCGHAPEEIPALDAEVATSAAELVYPCRYENLHFDKGLQHMDGQTALKYVRSRHSKEDGTDFGRAQRQQKLILAVKQKVMSVGFVSRVIPFMDSLGNDFKTDLSIDDVKTLAQKVSELNDYSVSALALSDQNYLINTITDSGQDVLMSKDGQDNWQSVHTWLANTFSGKPVPALPIVRVLNGTKAPGLAQHATDRLTELHFQTRAPGSVPDHATPVTSITVYDPTIAPTDLATLKKEFNVTSITFGTTATPSAYNIQIVLGINYQPTAEPTQPPSK